jgi:hypothetical protein
VGKLRLGRRVCAALLAAIAAAGCAGSLPHPAAGPAGYLAAGRSSVALLPGPGWPDRLKGSLELQVITGTAPHKAVSARRFAVSGRWHGRQLTVRIGGRTARGRLSGQTLRLGPLPGGARTRTFIIARAGRYGRAVASLRDRVARANDRQRQATRAVGALLLTSISVRQARRVVSRELGAMSGVVTDAAAALARTGRDTAATLARARQGARREQICGYATVAASDAMGVSAYRSGMAADVGSLQEYLAGLRAAMRTLSAQLRAIQHGQPSQRAGRGQPGQAAVAQQLSSARRRITAVLAGANSRISRVNHDVAAAYRLSARASAAGRCRSAPPPPSALSPAGLRSRARLVTMTGADRAGPVSPGELA